MLTILTSTGSSVPRCTGFPLGHLLAPRSIFVPCSLVTYLALSSLIGLLCLGLDQSHDMYSGSW